jgi:TonB family protein
VQRPLPWLSIAKSYAGHVAVIAAVIGFFQLWPSRPQVIQPAAFSSKDVVYYDAAEYLPPINTGAPQNRIARKGEPEHAPQPIISVPPEADNSTQTIVAPPKIQLKQDVPLPNVVAWSQTNPAVPLSATTRAAADLKLPTLPTEVVAPAPDVSQTTKRAASLEGAVVAPPPDVMPTSTRKLGDLNIGHSEVVAPAPKLAMSEQRTLSRGRTSLGDAAAVPPPPSVQTAVSNNGGRLIALGIHPLAPSAPLNPPTGNRRGTFAATPEGKTGAVGTPEIANGVGTSSTSGKSASGIPSGIQVGAAPKAATSAIGGNGDAPAVVADARSPRVGDSAIQPTAELFDNPTEVDRQVFGGRKSYSMTLSMPNLNSGGGSWVIHFAEVKESEKGELSAPVAEHKVDPGYPMELMRHNIGGTVTLYAVINNDGSVDNVRVLQGVDDRLDEYARAALTRWRFRPATRNGEPVSLEAVVMIPFKPIRNRPAF